MWKYTLWQLDYIGFIAERNRGQWQKRKNADERNPRKTVARASWKKNLQKDGLKNTAREIKTRKWKQAVYNFKEKEAVKGMEENIYSGN